MIKTMGMLILTVLLMTAVTGCHSETTEGLGRDVQKMGEKIEG